MATRVEPAVGELERLASASVRFDRQRNRVDELRQALRPLEEADLVPVVGEIALLDELEGKIELARDELTALTAGGADAEQHLTALEEVLGLPEWDIVEALLAGAAERVRAQHEVVREYENRMRDWRARVDGLMRTLDSAVKKGALVRRQKARVDRLSALVQQLERAMQERRYLAVHATLARLDKECDKHPEAELVEEMEDAGRKATEVRQQAGLLMIQAPLDDHGRFAYTVLLRTASAPGANSINIQGSSTLVEQDRQAVKDVIDEVTQAVDAGLSRRFHAADADGTRHVGPTTPSDPAHAGDPLDERVARVGRLMYRLVMPEPMQSYVREADSSLSITTNDLELPWELMHDDEDFLCLKRPVARMPMGRAFPRQTRTRPDGGNLRFLLIYSDPTGDLPKAEHEVKVIEEALRDKWHTQIDIEVLKRERVSGAALNKLLAFDAFDVIHYAGHAMFDQADADLSGLLLHDEEVFFAQKIRRLLSGRPLVFINACESGRTANEENPQCVGHYMGTPAEGLASAFLYGGALACIGSLWPIFDSSAEQFAVSFYNEILEGNVVGEAMRLARREIKRKFPDDITWASFVLYGDPTFRLARAVT